MSRPKTRLVSLFDDLLAGPWTPDGGWEDPRCAEVEAVPADALRAMVEGAIRSHIPAGEWERLQDIEDQERASWHEVMAKIGDR